MHSAIPAVGGLLLMEVREARAQQRRVAGRRASAQRVGRLLCAAAAAAGRNGAAGRHPRPRGGAVTHAAVDMVTRPRRAPRGPSMAARRHHGASGREPGVSAAPTPAWCGRGRPAAARLCLLRASSFRAAGRARAGWALAGCERAPALLLLYGTRC
ncbi:MAG: hypothetical protein J3K34DRAFT_527045 [Monoraphidium minutum]|nr:MAG: hypothetical protein J3K34DRAFT_527045 [Monoraphidium minutum]